MLPVPSLRAFYIANILRKLISYETILFAPVQMISNLIQFFHMTCIYGLSDAGLVLEMDDAFALQTDSICVNAWNR